jgi:threonine/homoserine/homoserine lactone efflux protein
MTIDQAIAFLLFATVAAITPGPSNVMITATGSAVGFARGLPCALGAATGMGSLLLASAMGLGQAVLAVPALALVMKGLGAAFLLWLAWRIGTAQPGADAAGAKPVGFLGAALFQWLNPKGWLVAVSAAGAYLPTTTGRPVVAAATMGGLFFLAALPSGLVWLGFGAAMQGLLGTETRHRLFNIVMAVALAGSVLLILR